MAQPTAREVWSILENLSFRPFMALEYWGFAGAQGNAIALKSERGIILDSQEGVKLTTSDSAARYMAGEIKWAEVTEMRQHVEELPDGRTLTAWVEANRFVGKCKCRPIAVADHLSVGGEDDCPVHGFEAPKKRKRRAK